MNRDQFGTEAVALLRRIDAGEEAAYAEIAPLLARVDAENARTARWLHESTSAREKAERERDAKRRRSRLGSGKFEIAPSREAGVDHGSDGIVLLRKGKHRLIWRGGSKYWSGVGMPAAYAPAELSISAPSGHGFEEKKLTDNHGKKALSLDYSSTRRLSSKTVMMFRKEIDAVFGKGAAERAAELALTVVL